MGEVGMVGQQVLKKAGAVDVDVYLGGGDAFVAEHGADGGEDSYNPHKCAIQYCSNLARSSGEGRISEYCWGRVEVSV